MVIHFNFTREAVIRIIGRQYDADFKRQLDEWWRAFGKPELNLLVEAVLQKNLDIKKASARILEIRSQFVQTRANRFPRLNFQGQAQRQRQTVEVELLTLQGITQEQRRTTIDSHSLSLPACFEVDLWGRLARAKDTSFFPGPGRSDPGYPFKRCKYRPCEKPLISLTDRGGVMGAP